MRIHENVPEELSYLLQMVSSCDCIIFLPPSELAPASEVVLAPTFSAGAKI